MADEVLYKDEGITLTSSYIQLNKYYFPLATSKLIMFSQVESIQLNNTEGVTHRWGVCTKYLNNWFNLDSKRSQKKKFIALKLKGRNVKPSFTPDDPDKVVQIIWQNQTVQGKEYVQKTSSKIGKETEIAQQQMMERLQEEKQQQQVTLNELKVKN